MTVLSKLLSVSAVLVMCAASGYADMLEDVVTLNSNSECLSGCGTTDFYQSTESTSPTVVGAVLFTFFSDFNVYLTDPGSGLVVDHIFADEGLGDHDATYFSNLAVTTDSSIGAACPNLSECVAVTYGAVQDLSSMVLAQDSGAGGGDYSLTVESFEATPEPSTSAMLLGGAALVAFFARRRKQSV